MGKGLIALSCTIVGSFIHGLAVSGWGSVIYGTFQPVSGWVMGNVLQQYRVSVIKGYKRKVWLRSSGGKV